MKTIVGIGWAILSCLMLISCSSKQGAEGEVQNVPLVILDVDIPSSTDDMFALQMLYKYADINVLNASYIKLRDISLTYHLPAKACKAIKARNASFMIQASDLLLIPFNKEGIDPEAFYLAGGSRGDRFRPYFTAGLNVEF